jgi:hypothetical protein
MSQAEKAVNKAADTAKDVAQDVADTAKEAVNTTRRTAANALDKAEEGVKSIERELNPVIDDLAARAQELATRGINFCADSSDRARHGSHHALRHRAAWPLHAAGSSHGRSPGHRVLHEFPLAQVSCSPAPEFPRLPFPSISCPRKN